MHLFHKWSKWEQYIWAGTVQYIGPFSNPERKPRHLEEQRQRRKCSVCGKAQDKLV